MIWCSPEKAKVTARFPLAQQIADIVATCSELRCPTYSPSPWAASTYANVFAFMLKDCFHSSPPLLHEAVVLPDGGSVSIDYADDVATQSLSDEAPIVIVLHTITGSGPGMRWFLREASARGWRGCVFNRRAARERLSTPMFNVMGNVDDTRAQVESVRERYPKAFLAMVGVSAGSGLLVSYLGQTGAKSPVRAACCLCPAYDISAAFRGLSERHPTADAFILKYLKRRFITENLDLLRQHDSEAVDRCLAAATINDFILEHVPFTGSETVDEYFKRSNPMEHVYGISAPMLLLNSDDDMVCLPEHIREDIPANTGGAILVRTRRGSHCAFCEGLSGSSYLCRLSMDFLDAAHRVGTHPVEISARAEDV